MAEILRSPVEVGSWNPIIYKVFFGTTIPGGYIAGFQNHQQYLLVNLDIPSNLVGWIFSLPGSIEATGLSSVLADEALSWGSSQWVKSRPIFEKANHGCWRHKFWKKQSIVFFFLGGGAISHHFFSILLAWFWKIKCILDGFQKKHCGCFHILRLWVCFMRVF